MKEVQKVMKNFFNFNWPNWLLLVLSVVIMCIELGKENYVSACDFGFLAIFNMFSILVLYQRRIISEQEEQKERENKILETLKKICEDTPENRK